MKVSGAFDVVDYYFTPALVTTLNWCKEKCVAKALKN